MRKVMKVPKRWLTWGLIVIGAAAMGVGATPKEAKSYGPTGCWFYKNICGCSVWRTCSKSYTCEGESGDECTYKKPN